MYYYKPEASDELVVYPQVTLPLELEDAEAREGVIMNASESNIKSKEGEEYKWAAVCTKSVRVVKPLVLYMNEYGSDGVEGALSTRHQNYYTHLCELDEEKTKSIKIAAVGVGLGGGCDNTS